MNPATTAAVPRNALCPTSRRQASHATTMCEAMAAPKQSGTAAAKRLPSPDATVIATTAGAHKHHSARVDAHECES
jgi:hypothetical protein